ncbi:hypothetical protein [Pseudoxanthomonas broegbernensis]|nr:hypothetical protein [Pseudoxanthomonas broegbernensis]
MLSLDHQERRRYCDHISRINKTVSAEQERRGIELGE